MMVKLWPAARRVLDAGWEGLRGLEERAAASAASLLGALWAHVAGYTGAQVCML